MSGEEGEGPHSLEKAPAHDVGHFSGSVSARFRAAASTGLGMRKKASHSRAGSKMRSSRMPARYDQQKK